MHHGERVLTRLQIRNFKLFSDADIELGPVTVLCGPNNSGKTAALQAIALWRSGTEGLAGRTRQRLHGA